MGAFHSASCNLLVRKKSALFVALFLRDFNQEISGLIGLEK